MPLPDDAKVVALANDLLAVFDQIFGLHPGYRAAHAKGIMLKGTFKPSHQAVKLSRAEHFSRELPVFVRFSNSTGLPQLPDNDPAANPRGFALRFFLAEHRHTDIVGHSIDSFPNRDGAEFLDFLKATIDSQPRALDKFIAAHPATESFIKAPKPTPASFATEKYFAVLAFKFINAQGAEQYGRFRILPESEEYLSQEEAAKKDQDFLLAEIVERLEDKPVRFKLMVQLAQEGDITDDATVRWPEDRPLVELGAIELTEPVEDNAAKQQQIIFDPIPRIDGLEASDDPLFELRAAIYLLSGRRRRAAAPVG
ncbi:MAG: catalase family peroxidase [Candidatus Melainabacteria bacterium]|nr:catalase family peroxidase [Candidatus Melainabacteria bacterium]